MKSLVKAIEFDKLVKEAGHITKEEKLIGAFRFIRDIPYGGKNTKDPQQVVEQNQGTGSGKHQVLKNLFEKLGYKVRECLAKHDFARYPINPWPDVLASFKGKHLTGYHDCLQVEIDGKWVIVDATFDTPLKTLGFAVSDWDGKTDMKLPVAVIEIIPVTEGTATDVRRRLLKELPAEEQEARKMFLRAMKGWIAEQRTQAD